MRVRDYMTVDVLYASPGDTLRQTFFRMAEHRIRHLPVLDAEQRLVGIISDRDLRAPDPVDETGDIAEHYTLEAEATVEAAMTAEPVVTRPEDTVQAAAALLIEGRFGALPVVDEAGKVVGILSAVDLMRALVDVLDRG